MNATAQIDDDVYAPYGVLDAEELSALARARRSGFCPPYAFPAPAVCRSLEDWARDGDRRWALLFAKIRQSRPTAFNSTMLS